MKMINKVFAAALAAAITAQSFVAMCVAADSPSVTYTFDTQTVGIADGKITVSGIPSDATYVKLYWGSDEKTALAAYSPIKLYTSASKVAYNEETLSLTEGSLSYIVEGNRYLPEAAKYIVAEIENADSTVTTVSSPLTNTGYSEDDMLYSMFWVSDTHMRWFSYRETSNQYKGFNIMRDIADKDGEKFKGVIINGDMADSAKEYEYGLLEKLIDATLGNDYPVYYSGGNHDNANASSIIPFSNAMNYRFDKLKDMGYTFKHTDKWSYDTYINGQHYIFFATPYGTSYSIGDSQYEWLEAKLSESDRSGVKSYVFSHLTVEDTVPGSSKSGAFNKENEEFAKIMERHPNTVVITSHIHLEMDSDMKTLLSNSDKASYLDTSSLYYTNVYPDTDGKEECLKDTEGVSNAYGSYVQIYEDKIVVKTMNFQTNKWVPRAEYVIPVDNSVVFEGTPSISNSSESLAVGNVLTAKLDGSDVDTDKYSCEWFISGMGSVGTDTTYTITTADKNVSLKITDKETGAYAYATTGIYSYTELDEDTSDTETTLTPPIMTNDNTVVENDDIIMVTGNVGIENVGKNILIVIAPQTSYNDISTAKYINEVMVESDGSYTFKFKADGVNEDDVLMAKLDGKDITNSIITAKGKNEFGIDMALTLSSANVPTMSIVNKYLDSTENIKAIIATYDTGGRLIKASVSDWDMVFGEYGETQKYSLSSAVEGATVKAFLFKDFETVIPLSESDSKAIAVIANE